MPLAIGLRSEESAQAALVLDTAPLGATFCMEAIKRGWSVRKALLFIFVLIGMSAAFSSNAEEVATRCTGEYPYQNRPCDQGQAYLEVRRTHLAWLKVRSDFYPMHVRLTDGITGLYEWMCGTNIPWVPVTGCGEAYFRPQDLCANRPSLSLPGAPAGQKNCDQGCEYNAAGNGQSTPTGAVCLPPDCPSSDGSGCGKAVAELQGAAMPSTDPRHLFHLQQTCIAKGSCEIRCQMDNCQWMDHVIPAFVDPYLEKRGLWPFVEASCSAVNTLLDGFNGGKWVANQECFASMGWYHVQVDLRGALEAFGCGSQRDWNMVGQRIVPCLMETQPGNPRAYHQVGGIFVHLARERVRQKCISSRQKDGLPVDINQEMGGKVCMAE